MLSIKIWGDSASEKQLRDIAARLKDGEIGIIPTDTLYGIVCDALNVKAIERVCRLKGINPEKSNLSLICRDIAMAADYARIENRVFKLMKENCPAPVTFLLRSSSALPRAFKGRKTVGIRIPDCEFDRQLADALQGPMLTTSIEYSDEDYARNPELIAETYEGKVDFIVMGEDGRTDASTIVDCTGSEPEITRQGEFEIDL